MTKATRKIKLTRPRKRASTLALKRRIELMQHPRSPEAPLMKLCAEYLKLELRHDRRLYDHSEWGSVDALNYRQFELMKQIAGRPAHTLAGMQAKAIIAL